MYIDDISLQLYLILPEILLACAGMGMAIYAAFYKQPKEGACTRGIWFAAAVPVLALALQFALPNENVTIFSGMMALDGAASFLNVTILIATFAALVLAASYYKRYPANYSPEFAALVLLAAAGMCFMVMARHFLSLYVALELQSLALYVLATLHRKDNLSTEAGVKYFVLGSLSSCMFLFGVSLVYASTGSLLYSGVAAAEDNALLSVGLIMAMAAFFFKISAAPFHMWTPDVYQGAPKTSLTFFAGAGKAASFGALAILASSVLYGFSQGPWREALIFVALASAFVGALGGIMQKDLRRLLAFSSVGHMGYAIFGLASGTPDGIQAALVYIAVYVAMTLGFLACLIIQQRKGADGDLLDGLKGLAHNRPGLALAISVLAFSMAGIPPFAGFFAKLLVFKSLISAQYYMTAAFGIACSVIASFYYLRLVKCMYFDEGEKDKRPSALCKTAVSVLAVSAAFNIFFVLSMDGFMSFARQAAFALLS